MSLKFIALLFFVIVITVSAKTVQNLEDSQQEFTSDQETIDWDIDLLEDIEDTEAESKCRKCHTSLFTNIPWPSFPTT